MKNLLVIDDESLILDLFRYTFSSEEVAIKTARSAAEGLEIFSTGWPDVVLLDVKLPDESGIELFRKMRERNAKVPTILMTGHGTAATAIEAMRLGAFEYVLKPFAPEPLIELIQRAFETRRLMAIPALVAETEDATDSADLLIGKCPEMQEVYRSIGRVSQQNVTTLILGESGTGKEVVARAIYNYSQRASGPFLAINCAAIPETLLESELFGHEKGAFTGADKKRIGKFEQCHGGTLFLDEIGDMTPLTQVKLLRVLQDQQFERLGGSDTIKTDVRIIAATNRNLEEMIETKQFRRDLFYRLNVFTIRLPPLRDRGNDLKLLVNHFLRKFSRELKKETSSFTTEALHALEKYRWPGNVRELQSVLKNAILQSKGPQISQESLPTSLRDPRETAIDSEPRSITAIDLSSITKEKLLSGSTDLYNEVITLIEKQLLTDVLQHTSGNLSQAARILGINRATLRTKLAACGIQLERTMSIEEKE